MAETDLPDRAAEPQEERGPWHWVPERIRPFFAVMHDATDGLFRHDGVMVASAIAFSLIFAFFPFLIFIVALGAVIGGANLSDYISREALEVLPDHIVKTFAPELQRLFAIANRASPLTFGLLVTLISITGAVEAIRDGLNRAYGCSENRALVRRYASSLLFVFGGMVFLLSISALGVAVPVWIRLMQQFIPEARYEFGLLELVREAALVVITGLMIAAMHLLLPARKRRIKSVATGALLTLILWWIAGKAFGFYINRIADYSATYAGLAGVVALMFFLYIQALIFLYGAELNRSIADFRGTSLCRETTD